MSNTEISNFATPPRTNAKITFVDAILVDLPTIRAYQLSMATMQQQTMVVIRLRSLDGNEGIGESTTIGGLSYGEESPEGIKLSIDTYLAPALIGEDATRINAAMLELNKVARGNRFAKSGIETALLMPRANASEFLSRPSLKALSDRH